MSHVIGIDVGTSGIKIGATNHEGKLCFFSRDSFRLHYPFPGAVEINPLEIWQKVSALIKLTADQIRDKGGMVSAISFSTFCNASIWMDGNGDPVSNGILYMDKRSKREVEWVRSRIPEERLFSITGNRIEPGMFSVSSLLWVKENQPDDYLNSFKWGHLSTYLLAKLTGAFVMDWTQASFTGLFDISNYCWSDELCETLDIKESILPEIVEPGRMIGCTLRSLVDTLGLVDIPVIAGAADTACSTFALGVSVEEVFESVGTSDVLTVVSDTTQRFDRRFLNRCHVVKGQWLSHGAMSTPGAAVQWFYNEFLQSEGTIEEVFERLPAQSQIGSNGVFFLPYMHGERSPIWDPDARGLFIGLSLNTRKQDMARAILEGCSFGMKQLMSIIHERFRLFPTVLTCIGGGSKNQIWNQIKANVLETEMVTMEVGETALMGACFLGGLSIGMYTNEDFAHFSRGKRMHHYFPESSASSLYQTYYDLYNDLYPTVKQFYKKLADLNV